MSNQQDKYLQHIRQVSASYFPPNYQLLRNLNNEDNDGVMGCIWSIVKIIWWIFLLFPLTTVFAIVVYLVYYVFQYNSKKNSKNEYLISSKTREFWDAHYRKNPNPYYVFRTKWFEQNFKNRGITQAVQAAGGEEHKYFRFSMPMNWGQELSLFHKSFYMIHLNKQLMFLKPDISKEVFLYFDKISQFFQIYTSHRGITAQFLETNRLVLEEFVEIATKMHANCRLYFLDNKLIFEIFGNYELYIETFHEEIFLADFEKEYEHIYADFENLRQLVELLTKIRLNDANEFV